MREYKAVSPDETISRINDILENIGIKTKKIVFGKHGVCHSVRLTISGTGFDNLDIGTNGKGMSEAYATASAYGELMERLENKMLLFYIKYASPKFRIERPEYRNLFPGKLSFRYFQDEEYVRISDEVLCEWGRKLLPDSSVFNDSVRGADYDMPFVPFYDVFSDKEEKLPYDLIRFAAGSTGLCAGNVPKEAILQGINEIFERYVMQRIYLDRPVLPAIPLGDIAADDILHSMEKLSVDRKWRFIVKDCSLGKGFPVIGLLIIDDAKGTYTFRLGSDTYPEIALQRCFTEIFQGTDIDDSAFLPIDVSDNYDMAAEYRQNLQNGRGRFPSCIFWESGSTMAGNRIVGNETISENFNSVIGWLKAHGYKLYIRDNSFLGFPAYHIYIPGLSDVDARLFDIRAVLVGKDRYYDIAPEYRIRRLDLAESLGFIEKHRHDSGKSIRQNNFSWSRYNVLNKNLLLALMSYNCRHYEDAYLFMKDFLHQQELSGNRQGRYYYCVRDYFCMLGNGRSNNEILGTLGVLYTEEIAGEVVTDFSGTDNSLDNFPLSECFNCPECVLRHECGYSCLLALEARIQQIQESNRISQSSLRELFDNVLAGVMM